MTNQKSNRARIRNVPKTPFAMRFAVKGFSESGSDFLPLAGLLPTLAAVLAFEQIGKVVVDVELRPADAYTREDFDVGELLWSGVFETLEFFARDDQAATVVHTNHHQIKIVVVLGR